jgi:hypothetical protein
MCSPFSSTVGFSLASLAAFSAFSWAFLARYYFFSAAFILLKGLSSGIRAAAACATATA